MFDLHNQLDVIEKDVVYQTVAGLDLQCRIHMPAQPARKTPLADAARCARWGLEPL